MDRKCLSTLRRSVEFVRKNVNKDLAIQQLAILLEVGLEDGISMPELGPRLNMSQASVSKNVRMLSRFKDGDQIRGYELVRTQQDLDEPRRFSVHLTKKGESVLKALCEIMGKRLEP